MRRLLVLFVVLSGLIASPIAGASPEHAAPSASASVAAPESATAIVRLKDRKVFTLGAGSDGKSAADRARQCSQALERALDSHVAGEARFERSGEAAIVYLGTTPIVTLTRSDAEAAGAATLEALAGDVTSKIQLAINEERKRSDIAKTVFSFSLVVFVGLIAFLALGKVSASTTRARDWIEDNPERVPQLKVGGVELMRPAAVESLLQLLLSIAKRVVQLGVLYAWVIFSLSLFERTKGYTDKLTELVLGPLSGFLTRLGTGLPLAVVATLAILATALLVRFTGVFFAGVARGETTVDWVPQDLAGHVGVLVRIGIVVVATVVAAPLLTGSEEGVFARAGVATLIALGLAATPVLACGIVGSLVVFSRRLRPGDFIELAGRSGRIREVTLLEVAVEDESGCEVRIPHVVSLWHATRLMGPSPAVSIELCVDPKASQVRVRDVLSDAANKLGMFLKVDLVSIDADGALYRASVSVGPQIAPTPIQPMSRRTRSAGGRVSIPPAPRISIVGEAPEANTTTTQLAAILADALAKEGIALGRRRAA